MTKYYALCKINTLTDNVLKEFKGAKVGDLVGLKAGVLHDELNYVKSLDLVGEYRGLLPWRSTNDPKQVAELKVLCMQPSDVVRELNEALSDKDREIAELKALLMSAKQTETPKKGKAANKDDDK